MGQAKNKPSATPGTGRQAAAGAVDGAACGMCGLLQRSGAGLVLDSEHKACQLRLLSWSRPHMTSFHLAWMTHFAATFVTFAAAPLLPVIRNDLDLTKAQASASGIAAVSGTILARILMGGACDRWGPRASAAAIQLLTAAATFGMAAVANPAGFVAARLFVGLSLGSFVACQFWCTVMFSGRQGIVGTANALAAGWGNSAGGMVQLLMPLLLQGVARVQPDFVAWRCCYLIVGWLQVLAGVAVFAWGQDLPGGSYAAVRAAGDLPQPSTARQYWVAARNHRTWLLFSVYGCSYGVELTMNSVLAQYFYDTFSTSLTAAGALAATFGLANLACRPGGGWLSDAAARRFGMPGRLWVLYLLLSGASACCCGLSRTQGSLGGSAALVAGMAVGGTAAAGATFGIVPFVSRRGLGAVNGIVGSGGSVGSILLQGLFFTGNSIDWGQAFLGMGLTTLAASSLLLLLRFPMWGGMLPVSWLCCLPARRRASGGGCCAGADGRCDVTEEEYYSRDFTVEEQRLGLHASVLKFMQGAPPPLPQQPGGEVPLPAPLPPPMHMAKRLCRLEDRGFGGTVSTGATSGSLPPPPGTPLAANSTAAVSPCIGASFAAVGHLRWAPSPAALQGMVPLHPLPAAASPQAVVLLGNAVPAGRPAVAAAGRPRPDGRRSALSGAERVERLLERFPRSFCQELQIDIASGSPMALWQWQCASVLFSARIKSTAGINACRELLQAGLTTPVAMAAAGHERVRSLLAASGYDKTDERTASYLVDNAQIVLRQYGGDLNQLRQQAGRSPAQERALLKKLRGTGDGAVDIFFRQAQVVWEELFPFADRKALRAARLVGLREHPQALADVCGDDCQKFTSLLAALVRADMTKSFAEL